MKHKKFWNSGNTMAHESSKLFILVIDNLTNKQKIKKTAFVAGFNVLVIRIGRFSNQIVCALKLLAK